MSRSPAILSALCLVGSCLLAAITPAQAETPPVAVGPQYDTSHIYVDARDFDRFVASIIAIFGGATTKRSIATVTPTPSETLSQAALTPFGSFSVFGYKSPIPYPFGAERTGYLVADMDAAIKAARAAGAAVVVEPFPDPIGRDAVIEWPGGVLMQLYWHTTTPSYAPLRMIPENRIYLSADRADEFAKDFLAFSGGRIVSDDAHAPGVEIGRPGALYRRIRIDSLFGKMVVLVTDGQLPFPYGRETTGYEVANLAETLAKASSAGAAALTAPYVADGREAAMIAFPGGYIAEIHAQRGD